MVLNRRERIILAAAIVAVAVLVGDRYILSPVLAWQERQAERKEQLQRRLIDASTLFKQRKAAEARWREMVATGMKHTAADTENAMLHAVRDWAQEARLSLSSVRPERVVQKGRAQETAVLVNANGSMAAVSRFLWRLQTSPLPVKAVEMQLSARREGTDDLALQLRLSGLFLPAPAERHREVPEPVSGEPQP